MAGYVQDGSPGDGFERSRELFESLVSMLSESATDELTHTDLEDRLASSGPGVDPRSDSGPSGPARRPGDRSARTSSTRPGWLVPGVENGHERTLTTVFGPVQVRRMAYRAPGAGNLYPADAVLNLPAEQALARAAATGRGRGGPRLVRRRRRGDRTGHRDAGRQTAGRSSSPGRRGRLRRVLRQRTDRPRPRRRGRAGAVRRRQGRRDAPGRAAPGHRPSRARSPQAVHPAVQGRETQPQTDGRGRRRLRPGPHPRTPGDIITTTRADARHDGHTTGVRQARRTGPADAAGSRQVADRQRDRTTTAHGDRRRVRRGRTPRPRPRPHLGRAGGRQQPPDRPDPAPKPTRRGVTVTIVVDFIHVLEYLWKAAWCFHPEGDPAAETWVARHALRILDGNAGRVAAAIRRKATTRGLDPAARKNADTAADYLITKGPTWTTPPRSPTGWPIATGVIEGACRHLVKDRMDITGARWGLPGAEAILKLRALISNGDFDNYWRYHLAQERHRIHRPTTKITPSQRDQLTPEEPHPRHSGDGAVPAAHGGGTTTPAAECAGR